MRGIAPIDRKENRIKPAVWWNRKKLNTAQRTSFRFFKTFTASPDLPRHGANPYQNRGRIYNQMMIAVLTNRWCHWYRRSSILGRRHCGQITSETHAKLRFPWTIYSKRWWEDIFSFWTAAINVPFWSVHQPAEVWWSNGLGDDGSLIKQNHKWIIHTIIARQATILRALNPSALPWT